LDVGRPNYANYGGTPYDTWTAWNANGVTGYTHPVGTPYVPTANYSLNNANGATFVLMEVVADATTGADTAYIWFNPNLNVAPSIATADVTDSGNIDLSAAFGLRFNANAASGIYTNATVQFDEIRVGLGALDVMPVVVPEPAIFALAMIGGLGLVALKRKRQ